ncbi:DNA repair and recombination protein RAD54B [Psilocybe cubensis]|uniref:DNA repair and recombination protein RAD54B n=2 Tax=Psilocybe cubensis TaxID=181762 RepID=A0ACB8HBA6_PSICU|nr:DNA repair and recombination protein RAD54B [Psilocybe cubensis]KAH9485283.1 DNA repair and recombination protein RAD54B [Psilocybe cubensis]
MPAFQQPYMSGKRKATDSSFSENQSHESRKRILLTTNPNVREEALPNNMPVQAAACDQVWMVQWRHPQYKKHKTWDGDAILVVSNEAEAILYDTEGKIMTKSKVTGPLYEGKALSIASKEIELERMVSRDLFLSGACFGNGISSSSFSESSICSNKKPVKKFTPPSLTNIKSFPLAAQSQHKPLHPTNLDIRDSDVCMNNEQESDSSVTSSEVTNQFPNWIANWRKPQDKKNKTWDGDAYISLMNNKLVMISEDGKVMGSIPWKGQNLQNGHNFFIGGKEVELDVAVSSDQLPTVHRLELKTHEIDGPPSEDSIPKAVKKKFVSPGEFYGPVNQKAKKPLHDPTASDSLIMKAPTQEQVKRYNKKNFPIVDVVVDPIISRKLRPHQKEGVKFMYECVMGLRKHEGQGCILADEMGLGKTLQTIALVWTLLRQNPYAAPVAAVQKVLIVCPVSLVNNWKNEFHKWLGRDRIGVMTCDKNHVDVDLFGRSKVYQVLVVGYERLRTVVDKLTNIYPPIGLIICDEGHRLKSANNKTSTVFKSFDTKRRVILSGTPIQNDLGEFHAMADFCNPGLLDEYNIFRKVYETPILKSRAPHATKMEIQIGEARTEQLLSVAKSFVLRRDATLLKSELPPKSEYVVFITPTALQLAMYQKILHPQKIDHLMQASVADSLALINILIKISNSPILLKATVDSSRSKSDDLGPSIQKTAVAEALSLLPEKAHIADLSLGGKLVFLANILKILHQNTTEKCVLVSHYTSTLNILEAYCKKMSYSYYRLDGQTPQNKRQEYVNAFNTGNQRNSFVFLLSSKAGGVGINLIGGSRLFIFDSDWNPSHDLQAMARCHRDGQKKPVYIYRMLTTGTIDEKIYQRQVTKLALSESLIGTGASSSKSDSFTRKDLRDIFRVHTGTDCNTHDLLECNCNAGNSFEEHNTIPVDADYEVTAVNTGFVAASNVCVEEFDAVEKAYLQKKKAGLASLGEWNHINCLKLSKNADGYVHDEILRRMITQPGVPGASERQKERTNILKQVDIENLRTLDSIESRKTLPGGTISFLFEKYSKINLYEDANVAED